MTGATVLASAFRGDEMITINLEDGGSFNVQRAMLCQLSKYFDAALNGGFEEGKNKTLVIPGCCTKTFELLLYWMCKSEIPDFQIPEAEPNGQCSDARKAALAEAQLTLIQLWVVADMLMLPKLQNAVITPLLDVLIHSSPTPKTIRLAIESTATGSPLFRLVLQECFSDCAQQSYDEAEKKEIEAIPGVFSAFMPMIARLWREDGALDCADLSKAHEFLVPV